MAPFSRKEFRFEARAGLNVARPVDQLQPGDYPILTNLRTYIDGVFMPRNGLTKVGAGTVVASQTPVHSIRRLNNKTTGKWMHTVGVGTHLATNPSQGTAYTDRITGLSGNPLSLVPFRPNLAPYPWMYIGDSSAYSGRTSSAGKITQDPTNDANVMIHSVGLPPPANPPSLAAAVLQMKLIEYCDTAANWTKGGTMGAGASTSVTRVDAATITISYILYDTGNTGWCLISPSAWSDNFTVGMFVKIAAAEYCIVTEVHPGLVTGGVQISSITYDSGATGNCSIVLNVPVKEIEVNSLVRLGGGGGELVRVLSISDGPTGTTSFRCSTTVARASGDTVEVFAAFRCYTTANRVAPNSLGALGVKGAATGSGTGTLTLTSTLDLTMFAVPGTPILDEDIVHIGLRTDHPENITQIKVKFDVDVTTNDFTKNYYFYGIDPSDLVPVERNIRTVRGGRPFEVRNNVYEASDDLAIVDGSAFSFGGKSLTIKPAGSLSQDPGDGSSGPGGDPSRGGIPGGTGGQPGNGRGGGGESGGDTNPGPGTGGTGGGGRRRPIDRDQSPALGRLQAGGLQWSEIRFTVGDLKKGRVGTDAARTLANVKAVQVEVVHTAGCELGIDDLYIMGGGALDSGPDWIPYYYRYRGRVSTTGARSNYSPPTRSGIVVRRQNVSVTLTQHPTTECDKLDVERIGGSSDEWHYVGTVDNGASPVFTDNNYDDVVVYNTSEGQTHYQPWPLIGPPISGTTAKVSGTTITAGAVPFNTSWAPGTVFRLGGIAYTIYRVISTSLLELYENAGVGTTVGWIINQPVITGQPLPYMWGPFNGFMFACGDSYNPGVLYFSNGNDPDSTQPDHKVEITSPSEPLMNGCLYNGRCYVWSSDRMFEVTPTYNTGGGPLFSVQETPGSMGLYANWAFAVGLEIYFLGRDGMYISRGGESTPITDENLRPLFAVDGNNLSTVNNIPTVSSTDKTKLRLAFYNGYLYLDYENFAGVPGSLICEVNKKRWMYDTYSPGAAPALTRIAVRYGEEGDNLNRLLIGGANATTGLLYYAGGTTDDTAPINWEIQTQSVDFGDPRSNKLLGDVIADVNPAAGTIVAKVCHSYGNSTLPAVNITSGGRITQVLDVSTGSGLEVRNVSLNLTCASTAKQYLYLWEPSIIDRPETTYLRGTDTTDQEAFTRKYVRGIRIEADTSGVDRTVTILCDGVVRQTITVNHNGKREDEYGFTPFDGWELQLLPTDASTWKLYKWGFIFDEYPDIATTPTPWEDMGDLRAKWVQGLILNADTGGADAQIQIQSDGGVVEKTLTVNHNGQIVKAYPLTGQLWTPFITHKIRIVPVDPIGIFKDSRFVWEPEPELVTEWTTQATTHNLPGFQHLRELQIALRSTADVTLTVTVDGVAKPALTIPSTGGVHTKVRLKIPAYKGKLWTYSLQSTAGFRLYLKDCEVWVKHWGSGEQYQIVNPFGDFSREHGALI